MKYDVVIKSLLIISAFIYQNAASMDITGKVTDENGAPVAGAEIRAGNNGDIRSYTDSDGKYLLTIDVESSSTHIINSQSKITNRSSSTNRLYTPNGRLITKGINITPQFNGKHSGLLLVSDEYGSIHSIISMSGKRGHIANRSSVKSFEIARLSKRSAPNGSEIKVSKQNFLDALLTGEQIAAGKTDIQMVSIDKAISNLKDSNSTETKQIGTITVNGTELPVFVESCGNSYSKPFVIHADGSKEPLKDIENQRRLAERERCGCIITELCDKLETMGDTGSVKIVAFLSSSYGCPQVIKTKDFKPQKCDSYLLALSKLQEHPVFTNVGIEYTGREAIMVLNKNQINILKTLPYIAGVWTFEMYSAPIHISLTKQF